MPRPSGTVHPDIKLPCGRLITARTTSRYVAQLVAVWRHLLINASAYGNLTFGTAGAGERSSNGSLLAWLFAWHHQRNSWQNVWLQGTTHLGPRIRVAPPGFLAGHRYGMARGRHQHFGHCGRRSVQLLEGLSDDASRRLREEGRLDDYSRGTGIVHGSILKVFFRIVFVNLIFFFCNLLQNCTIV